MLRMVSLPGTNAAPTRRSMLMYRPLFTDGS
jgi:hypothetical protein